MKSARQSRNTTIIEIEDITKLVKNGLLGIQ